MESNKKPHISKVKKNMHNTDLNEVNSRTAYNKNYNEKSLSKSVQNEQEQYLNDNISEKANSVQTSYQYRKNKNGQNSTYSKGSSNHNHNNQEQQNDDQLSLSISDNDNLICANCINTVLIEEKQKRDDYDKNYNKMDGIFFR